MIITTDNSVRPSMKILSALREHDDFMESIRTVADLGCGTGEDLEWWATQTTREDSPQPLNIRCYGIDQQDQLTVTKKYTNIVYQQTDFEIVVHPPKDGFDVLWCHDAFQYCLDPIKALTMWKEMVSPGAMLVIAVPDTLQVRQRQIDTHLPSLVYYHYTMVNLIYMLALTGWDCRNGFFQHTPGDPWIRAVVYHTDQPVLPAKTTTWYDLMEKTRLFESAERSVHAHGHLRQQDLVVPWLDHNLSWLGKV